MLLSCLCFLLCKIHIRKHALCREAILADHNPRRKRKSQRSPREPLPSVSRAATEIRLRRVAPEGWELVEPRCARDRADDIEEVQTMIAAGEIEIARDEIHWLLQGCHDFLEAHKLLGELAYAEHDLPLARGHFGYAFRIGQQAIARAGNRRPIPYKLPRNQAFHQSGKAARPVPDPTRQTRSGRGSRPRSDIL